MTTSEIDALANMMAADSNRIDTLVNDVGVVKGKVDGISSGVDELRRALTVLVRHETLMSQNQSAAVELATRVGLLDSRLQQLEREVPALKETRAWIVNGMLAVLSVVLLAVVGIVVKIA